MAFPGLGSFDAPTTSVRLVPRLKFGRSADHSFPPTAFETPKGKLILPRFEDPPTPDYPTASMARQGQLIGTFRDGRIFPASDFIGQVSAQTAKISLDDNYDFQTRQLSALPSIADNTKSLRNLFYIALEEDELPSYHFWTTPDGMDPITKGKLNVSLEQSNLAGQEDTQQGDDEGGEDTSSGDLSNASSAVGDENSQQADSSLFKKPLGPIHGYSNPLDQRTQRDEDTPAPPFPPSSPFPSAKNTPNMPDWYFRRTSTANNEGSSSTAARRPSMFPSGNASSSSIQSPGFGQNPFQPGMTSRRGSMPAISEESGNEESENSSVLIYCERGGLNYHDSSSTAFKDMALYIVQHEENETALGSGQRFLDILGPPETQVKTHLIGAGRPFDLIYRREVRQFLGATDYQFRIRSDAYEQSSPWDNGGNGTLKLTRMGVGYCYVNAAGSWNDVKQRETNNERFESALEFLYGWDQHRNPDRPQPNKLTIEILAGHECPSPSSYSIDRGSPLPPELEETLNQLSKIVPLPANPLHRVQCRYSKEIFVHETGTDFVPPFAAATEKKAEAQKEEEEQAEEERPHEQIGPLESNDTGDTAQQPDQRRWSTVGPMSVLEYAPGPINSSNRPPRRTPSEIGDLERRLGIAEENLGESRGECTRLLAQIRNLEGQNTELQMDKAQLQMEKEELQKEKEELEMDKEKMRKEKEYQAGRASDAEDEVSKLLEERRDMRVQRRGLEVERDELRTKVNQLELAVEYKRQLSRLAQSDDQRRVERLSEERNHLQSRIDDLQQGEDEEAQDSDQPQNQANKNTKQDSAGLASTQRKSPAEKPPPQDAVAPAPEKSGRSVGPKKMLYCNICLSSVNTLNEDVRR